MNNDCNNRVGFMSNVKERIKIFIGGVIILTLGVSLTIKADLGAGAWDCVNVGLNNLFGLSVGTFVVVIAVCMFIIAGMLRDGKFNIYTLITSVCIGLCIDFWLLILGNIPIESSMVLRIISFILGIVLLACGVSLYLMPRLAPNPLDDAVVALSDRFSISIGKAKLGIEILGVTIALLVSGPIGFGTIVITLVIGPLIDVFTKGIESKFLIEDDIEVT